MFGVVGEPTTFQVLSKDQFGNSVSQGGAQVRVRVASAHLSGKDAILELGTGGAGSAQSEDRQSSVAGQLPSPFDNAAVAAAGEAGAHAGGVALPNMLGTGAVHDLGNGEYSISYAPLFSLVANAATKHDRGATQHDRVATQHGRVATQCKQRRALLLVRASFALTNVGLRSKLALLSGTSPLWPASTPFRCLLGIRRSWGALLIQSLSPD